MSKGLRRRRQEVTVGGRGFLYEAGVQLLSWPLTAAFSGRQVTVEVTVDEDSIVDVVVLGHAETVGIGSIAIERLPADIVEQQTPNLDAIAGSTFTSIALLEAVETALLEAGASPEALFREPAGADPADLEAQTIETDVLIVGAGGAGLTAALSARENGVEDLLVIEKMPFVGGASSTAGGGMQVYRVDEDPAVTQANKESLFLYWNRTGKFTNNARLTMLAVEFSAPTIEWLSEVQNLGITGEEDPEAPTWSAGCEGRAAGAINTLYANTQEQGIPILLETRADHLIFEDGRVTGVEATGYKGQPITIKAGAVLLATGGYGNNPDLIPDSIGEVIYYGPVCPTGDGHIMASEIGVPLFNMDKVAIKHFGVETEPGFGIHIHGAVATLFNSTGAFAVSKEGLRVVNEGGDEYDIAYASLHDSSDGRLYITMDQASYEIFAEALNDYDYFSEEDLERFLAENGSGVTKLVKNDSLAEAAEVLGIDVEALLATVDSFNADAEAGEDAFDRRFVDTFGEGPYYILQTIPRFATSLGGVNLNNQLQVLDSNEQPIPGLFAAGEIVGNVNGSYAHYLIWAFGSGRQFGIEVPDFLAD